MFFRASSHRNESVIAGGWDLIIIDEAHRVAGQSSEVARHKLGAMLSKASPHILLLTATPHSGKTEPFLRLMRLLDESAFPNTKAIVREQVAPYLIRTEKRQAVDNEGNLLFKKRHTQVLEIEWQARHELQRQLYEEVTEYVRSGYNRAMSERKNYIGFLMILFQRLVSSSTTAIIDAMDRRLHALQHQADQLHSGNFAELVEADAEELILMDGMSFENLNIILRRMAADRVSFNIQSSFSFFPTVTSVARQSVFSGKLPCEHEKPFSLDNEEKQWRAYWRSQGYKDNEIAYIKEKKPDVPPQAKVAGIIINICDDLMHAEIQGLRGMNQGIEEWLDNGLLSGLIHDLLSRHFAVYMTSDHGNTAAIAQGRFTKPGLLADPASRRAVIYKEYADAVELAKFTTMRYDNTYLPDGINTYLFGPDACYGNTGTEYITHGGMTLEESIVPFVRIGEYNG